jgi:D-amino-acid oxidase
VVVGKSQRAIVLGAGVIGLSVSRTLATAGYDVEFWAAERTPNTTSDVAAAVWYPYRAYPLALVAELGRQTYEEFRQLAECPDSGVFMAPGIELFEQAVGDPWWRRALPVDAFERIGADDPRLPQGYQTGYIFTVPIADMSVYLRYLMEEAQHLGCRFDIPHRVTDLTEPFRSADIVVNCCGLGAGDLVADNNLKAIRGQIIRTQRLHTSPGKLAFYIDEHGQRGLSYIVIRQNDTILGGTADEGITDLLPNPVIASEILERCERIVPSVHQLPIIEHKVGLRPGRDTIRLERETFAPGKTLIHAYGHGGSGVTLSHGTAAAVVGLLR